MCVFALEESFLQDRLLQIRVMCILHLEKFTKLYSKKVFPICVSTKCYRCTCSPRSTHHHHWIFLVFCFYQWDKQNVSWQFEFISLVTSEIEHLLKLLSAICSSPQVTFICIHFPFVFWVVGLILINVQTLHKAHIKNCTMAISVAHFATSALK